MRHGYIIDYETVAARLANEDSEIQAAFFKVFLKELRACCETSHGVEKQLCWINTTLTPEERETLKMPSFNEPSTP